MFCSSLTINIRIILYNTFRKIFRCNTLNEKQSWSLKNEETKL